MPGVLYMNKKASLQIKHGYTRIANEILEVLAQTNLSSYQSRVLYAVTRKPYTIGIVE